jgi:hypothetical protein
VPTEILVAALGIASLVIGYLLKPVVDLLQDVLMTERTRRERRETFQLEMLLKLQQAMAELVTFLEFRGRGVAGSASDATRAEHDIAVYSVRITDEELRQLVATLRTLAYPLIGGIPGDGAAKLSETREAFDKANDRIGVVLRAL